MTTTTTTISNLPGDLLEAIFSRVPSECMREVRSTCKRWNTVTQSLSSVRLGQEASAARQGESRMVVLMDNDLHLVSVFADKETTRGIDLEVTRGLMNAYLAAKKPDEAVKFLVATRESLSTREISTTDSVTAENETSIDPIQVDLLLGKAYSDWGHISDAIAVYDRLITDHPEDFRGYLAKGIILKENGSRGDAERMFIQARFFAPEKAKAFVDRYTKL